MRRQCFEKIIKILKTINFSKFDTQKKIYIKLKKTILIISSSDYWLEK